MKSRQRVIQSILSRFGIYRKKLASTLNIFKQPRKGTVNGEGAAFFVVTGLKDAKAIASIEGVKTFYKADAQKLRDGVEVFIREAGLYPVDIDLVLLGKNGNKASDANLDHFSKTVFPKSNIGFFKHLTGEYPVASAFAMWLAARVLQDRHIPEVVLFKQASRPVRNVLILNSWFETHHSVMLLKSCRDII
jgi:3-oxoacyl-[acyl-carrier-protein] synthase II